jgi:hypothetical protein
MGALTINAADQTKRSHKLPTQPRATTRLPDSPNSYSTQTPSVKLDLWGSIGDFISKAIPWVLTTLGALFAIGLAARAHEQSSSPVKPVTDPHLQERETSFKAMLDSLSMEAKSLIEGTGVKSYSDLQEHLKTSVETIRSQTQGNLEGIKNSQQYQELIASSEKFKEEGGDLARSLSMILADLEANLNSEATRQRYNNALLDLRSLFSSQEFPNFLKMLNTKFPQAAEKRETARNIPIE